MKYELISDDAQLLLLIYFTTGSSALTGRKCLFSLLHVLLYLAEMSEETGRREPGALKSFLAGGVGGVCLVLTGHPLDTIKVERGSRQESRERCFS